MTVEAVKGRGCAPEDDCNGCPTWNWTDCCWEVCGDNGCCCCCWLVSCWLIWTDEGLALMEPRCGFSTTSGTVNDTDEYLTDAVVGVCNTLELSSGCGVNGVDGN